MSLPPAGFPPDQRAAAAGLSPAAGRFLEAVEADPGPFLFGDDFGGLFVRVLAVAGGPVVNLGRGAQVALAFTVGA